MIVYTLEQRFTKWAYDRLTEDADIGKKKSSFQMKLILIFWLRTDFEEAPPPPYVRCLVKKVNETGTLIDKPKREKSRTVRTPENITVVA